MYDEKELYNYYLRVENVIMWKRRFVKWQRGTQVNNHGVGRKCCAWIPKAAIVRNFLCTRSIITPAVEVFGSQRIEPFSIMSWMRSQIFSGDMKPMNFRDTKTLWCTTIRDMGSWWVWIQCHVRIVASDINGMYYWLSAAATYIIFFDNPPVKNVYGFRIIYWTYIIK